MNTKSILLLGTVFFSCFTSARAVAEVQVHGTLKKWHPVEVWFSGPLTHESSATPNPFLDYRLTVVFDGPNGPRVVPGYYDGNGAGAGQGRVWKAIIAPDAAGTWTATASFRV